MSSAATAGGGTGRCRARRGPCRSPTAIGLTTTSVAARRDEPGADADHVGDRVEGADLVEVHVERVVAVHRALGDGEPFEHAQRQVADGVVDSADSRSRVRMSRHVRWWTESATSTWTRVAAKPWRVTDSTRTRTGSGETASTAAG